MKTIEVVAAIIEHEGKYLATQRGYGDYKGQWEFPGGKIEPGEAREGAENDRNTYDTARTYLDIIGCDIPDIAMPDHERFAAHVRNISISMRKAVEASNGAIQFASTVEGLRRFVEDMNDLR